MSLLTELGNQVAIRLYKYATPNGVTLKRRDQ